MGSGAYGGHSYPIRPPAVGTVESKVRADTSALASLQRAGLLGLLGGLIGWGTSAYLSTSGALNTTVSMTPSGQPMIHLNTGSIEFILLIAVLSAAVEIVTLAYFLSAFRALREEDSDFEGPARYLWLALIALPILLLTVAYLLEAVVNLSQCVNALPANATWMRSCSSQADGLASAFLLLVVPAIIAFIGWIELLIGVYRLGGHFHEPNFKLAAILLLIPFLSVIGAAVIWYSARKLATKPPSSGFFT
jgi:heme/copper-type cytochrome/quinol oxidase subunit 2